MSNPFDQFDAQPQTANPFDQFDAKPKAAPEGDIASTIKRAAGGVISEINVPIGMANSAVKGLAGIAGLVKGAVTPGDSADNASERYMDAVGVPSIGAQGEKSAQEGMDVTQQVIGSVLNAPVNIYRAGENKAEELSNKLPWAGYVNNFINSHPFLVKAQAALKGAGDVVAQVAPMVAGGVKAALDAPKDIPAAPPALKLANDNGIAVIPSEAAVNGASAPVGTAIEGFSGAPKAATAAAIKNSKAINGMAAQELAQTAPELNIKPDTELTPEILDKARAANNAAYSQVAKLSDSAGRIGADDEYAAGIKAMEDANNNSFGANKDISSVIKRIDKPDFTSGELLAEMKRLRGNASANYKASSGAPGKNTYDLGDLADAQNTAADLLEDRLDRFAQQIPGQEDLAANLQQSRVNLAKINAIDNSIKAGTTNVNPGYFGRQLNNGAPLTGKLADIGTLANNFPKSIRDVSSIASKTPYSRLDMLGLGYSLSKMFTHPIEAAGGAAAFAGGPLARTGLLSDAYQNSLTPKAPSALIRGAPYAAGQAAQTGNLTYEQQLAQQLMGNQ